MRGCRGRVGWNRRVWAWVPPGFRSRSLQRAFRTWEPYGVPFWFPWLRGRCCVCVVGGRFPCRGRWPSGSSATRSAKHGVVPGEDGGHRSGDRWNVARRRLRHCGTGCDFDCGFYFYFYFYYGDCRSFLRNLIAVIESKNRTCILFRFGFARERDRRIDGILRTLKILN